VQLGVHCDCGDHCLNAMPASTPQDVGVHPAGRTLRPGWRAGIWLFFAALLSHGPLLLNDGIYWDGWLLYWLRRDQNWGAMVTWSKEIGGGPLRLVLWWILGALPDTGAGFKIAVFLSMVICALLVYLLAHRVGRLSIWESAFVALFGLVYPACQVSVEIICSASRIAYGFFLLAALLACLAERRTGLRHFLLRLGSLALFSLSFSTNSLLVFYAGFLGFWLTDAVRFKKLTLLPLVRDFLPGRLDYLLLPLVYWWLTRTLFPPSGLYKGYNTILLSGSILTEGYRSFFENSVYAQWNLALWRLCAEPWVGVVAVVIAGGVFVLARDRATFTPRPKRHHLLAIAYGLSLLLLGMFPYVVVGKAASIEGWTSRFALLVALPIGVIIVSLVGWLCAGRSRNVQGAGYAVLAALVWLFTVSTWNYYARWQARWVKDNAVITKLRTLSDERRYSVFWIDDRMPLSPEIYYRDYEWAGLFKSAWGDESHIGLHMKVNPSYLRDGAVYFTERYLLADFDPTGRQAQLIIQPGPAAGSEWKLVLQYWRYRFLETDRLGDFLSDVVSITVKALDPPEGRCRIDSSSRRFLPSDQQK
jgi:hypothetical protein